MHSLSPDCELDLRLLGGFDARLKNSHVAGITYNKMRALLAYLAVEREQDHSREALAELLWGGNDRATARGNLRRTLSDLRRALESPTGKILFFASKHTIRFAPNAYVDVLEFTAAAPSCVATPHPAHCDPCVAQMEHMAELYHGEFMAGFSLPDCPAFEDWLQLQREALRRRALALLERLSNCHEQAGHYQRALPFALRHAELDPWDENGHRRAIRLYALNGQDSAALGQYDSCFRVLKNEIGVLPNKETQGLAESIRKGEWRAEPLGATGEHPAIALPPLVMERRQVTVLYCELTLAAIGDPEEAMALLRAPQARCMEIIRQFSGHIVQSYGGGLLAYFGYPQAHEYAARHAVQAALAVARETAHDLEIRACVHTGLIIAGGQPSMPDTSGQTSSLAVQLRHGATPGEVVISRQTHCLVAGYFDCLSAGVQSLPGIAQPLEIFKVLRESGAHSRLETVTQLTPLAGRKTEINKLMAWWKKAAQGSRQVVLVQGDAGIGKSRLLLTLKQRLTGKPHNLRELRCFPEFSQSPFYPLVAMLENLFGFARDDTPETKFDKLAAYLEAHFPELAQEAVPLLAPLLAVPLADPYHVPTYSPQKHKEQTIAILLELLQAMAAQLPVLLIVEDLHWVDPSTLELLSLFVGRTGKGTILALFTARPEFDPPWDETRESSLPLAPLVENEAAQMIASISKDVSEATLRHIVQRADGIPLFVEEMAKIATLDNQASIPATLHDLLAARMDKMGDAKYTAQLAATLGREFDLDLLRKISPCDSATLAHNLSVLRDAGLVLKISKTVHQFKHALIQEAAYQSQTRSARQAAHLRIAQTMQSDFSDIAATRPELLAQHWSSAGETRQSIEYWIKAGQRAALNSANLEAIEHFSAGLQLLTTLPADQQRDRTEFNILVSLCPALYAAKGYGSAEVAQANARISVLGGLMGDGAELFQAKWALLINTIATTGSRGMPEAAMQLLGMAHDDPIKKQAAHHLATNAFFWLGEFESSRVHSEQAIALYHPDHRQTLLEHYGSDLSAFSAGYALFALYFLGFPDRAQQICGRMLKQARELAHPHTLAQALSFAAVLHRWLNKPEQALSLSAEAIVISRQQGFLLWLACGEMTHGWARVMLGQEEGISEIKASIAGMRAALCGISVVFMSPLIEAYMHLSRYHEALDLIAEAQADAEKTDDNHFAAELHRLKGECLLALSPSNAAQAESCFDQALAVSRKQQAKSLQLRAAISMARLWWQQGRGEEARCLLEEVYNGFTEGFDTRDLQEAAEIGA